MTSFGVLGPLLVSHAGKHLALGSVKQRVILAMLLLDAGRPVSVGRLIDGVWGTTPPAGVINSLHVHVSHLRRVLTLGDTPIRTKPPGYALSVESDNFDLLRFDLLIESAHEQIAQRHPSEAVETLNSALNLWRGPALDDLGPAPFGDSARSYLEERRLGAINDRLELQMNLGHEQTVIETCELELSTTPLRESLWEKLILALYRSGRQSDALAKYRVCREVLLEELGVEPMPRMRALERQILNQDPRLAAAPRRVDGMVVPDAKVATDKRLATTVQRSGRLDADLLLEDGRVVPLTEHMVLGRNEDCDIVIDDASVSRRHAEIRIANGRHLLLDLSSSNGTWVAGQPVLQHPLRNGDAIELGQQTLRYRTSVN